MPRGQSIAERYRAHRAAFLLAQELGCTPREAEAELARREAAARDAEAVRRLNAKKAGHPIAPDPESETSPQWWQRD